MTSPSEFEITSLTPGDIPWVVQLQEEHWGSSLIVTRGNQYDASQLPGFKATVDCSPVGLLTYRIENQACEIVSLNSLINNLGIGSALLNAVRKAALNAGCQRLWLITTNDNLPALHFYQKRGFRLVSVYPNALNESRKIKPTIPLIGLDGIPLRDEIELEMQLHNSCTRWGRHPGRD